MTDEQFKALMAAVNKPPPKPKSINNPLTDPKLSEWIVRALIGVLIWIGLNIKNDVDILKHESGEIKSELNQIKTERQYSERDLLEIQEFISKPRFTKEDFDVYVTPMMTSINKNSAELQSRNAFMDKVNNKLQSLDLEVSLIKSKLNNSSSGKQP